MKKYNGVTNRASRKTCAIRPSPPVFPAKNTDSIDCTQVSDRSGIQYDSDIIEINEGSLDIIDIDTSVTKKVLNDGMKLNDQKKRKRPNSHCTTEKIYVKDNEKKNFSVFQKRNHDNLPTPLQAFANEMMKENKNISTVPVQIKVANKDWTVNVSTTVVSQSKSSSEFPKNREALFKSLKEESYRLLKLVSKKNSIRNDVRMVFDPNENRITPFHINFTKDDDSNEKGPDNLDMTKFLSSEVEDSDDDGSNSDMSEFDGHDSNSSPISFSNAEYSGSKVPNEVHNVIDEESNEQSTFCRDVNKVDSRLKQCNGNVENRNNETLGTSFSTDMKSEINPNGQQNGFKNELNHEMIGGPSEVVILSKSYDGQNKNNFFEVEVNGDTSKKGTNILCISDISHLDEEVIVKNELDQQILSKKIIDEETGSVVEIEVFRIKEDDQGINTKSEEGTEAQNQFESEYIIPEIDFVDNSAFRCSNEQINVTESFKVEGSNSSYDFESDTSIDLTEDEASGMHSIETSQDVCKEFIAKSNEELVLFDNELPTSSLRNTGSDVKGEKDPLSIDGFTGGVLFYDPETDYDDRDLYSSDKNESTSNENNIRLSDSNENVCDNTQVSNEENTDDLSLSNNWNWSNLKKYNSKTTQNDLIKMGSNHCKEYVNKQSKEDDKFIGFSDCTDSSSKYSDFVSACSKLGYYDDMVVLNQHYEIISQNKKDGKFLNSGTSDNGLSKEPLRSADGGHSKAISEKKKASEVKIHQTPEGTLVKSHKSVNDPEEVFLGFKSNDDYTEFRRKSIEMSRRLSEEFLDGKNKIDQNLNSNVENISSFPSIQDEENTSAESFFGKCNLVKYKVSSPDKVELIHQSIEKKASLRYNRNSDLCNLDIDSKKLGNKEKNRSPSMESLPRKRGRPKKIKNQFTVTNTVNSTLNLKVNTDNALEKLEILENDENSIVNNLSDQSAKEPSQHAVVNGTEDKIERNNDLLKSPASTLIVLQCMNGSSPVRSDDEAREICHQSADISVICNESSVPCPFDINLKEEKHEENALDNSIDSALKNRDRPKKNHSKLITSSSTDQVNPDTSILGGNTDTEVKEAKPFQNEDGSIVNNLSRWAEQESIPISVTNIGQVENLRQSDQFEDMCHHSVDEVSLIPLENKENILSIPVESISRKRGRPKTNQCQSVRTNATTQCDSALDLKEENIEDVESNHFENNDLPHWTAEEQTSSISITNNDKICDSSKSPPSKLIRFSQCINNTSDVNDSCDKIEGVRRNSEELSSLVCDGSSFEINVNTLIASNNSVKKKRGRPRKNPVYLISSTPTKTTSVLYVSGENTNTDMKESNTFDNEESIINSSANDNNFSTGIFESENHSIIPVESIHNEENLSVIKQEDADYGLEKKLKMETNVDAPPLKRKPGRPPKHLSDCFQRLEQQREISNTVDSSLVISVSENKSLLLNSSASLECGPLSCIEHKNKDEAKDSVLVQKKNNLEAPLKRKPGRPPKCSSQLQKESNFILDTSLAISESDNKSLHLNSSATMEYGEISYSEPKDVEEKPPGIEVIEKKNILEASLKRKPGRPPKRSSLGLCESEQLQRESSKVVSSLAINEYENKSLVLNSSASLKSGLFSCDKQKNVEDKIGGLLPMKRKRGRPPKRSSLCLQGSDLLEREISNVVDSSLAISESENRSLLSNSSVILECDSNSCSSPKDEKDKCPETLLIEKKNILEAPLKRKPGRPPKRSSLCLQGSELLQKESCKIVDSSLAISESANRSLLLNSPVILDGGPNCFSRPKDEKDKCPDILLIEKKDIVEAPLKRKPGRPPKRLSLDKGEINNLSFMTETNLMAEDQLQIEKMKSEIESTSISTCNKVSNVSEEQIDLENKTSSDPILKRKPGRPPKQLSLSVNHQGLKSDQKKNEDDDSHLSSCDISESNSFVIDSSTNMDSSPLPPNHADNEGVSFKCQAGEPIKNRDILGLPLKRKPGRPPKNSLVHFGEIKNCHVESKEADSNDSDIDCKDFVNNSLCLMVAHDTEGKLLMSQKHCLKPPLKRKPGRPPKYSSICQQKLQEYPIKKKDSVISNKRNNLDTLSFKEVSSSKDPKKQLEDEEKYCLELDERKPDFSVTHSKDTTHELEVEKKNIVEPPLKRKPGRPPKMLSMGQQDIEICQFQTVNIENTLVKESDRSVNSSLWNTSSNGDDLSDISLSKENSINKLENEGNNNFEPPPKRKPGRPPKRLPIAQQEMENCQTGGVNKEEITSDGKRTLSNDVSNSFSYEKDLHYVSQSEHVKSKIIDKKKVSFDAPLKRKPGRPSKHLCIGQKDINLFQNDINIEHNVEVANYSMNGYSEPAPKKKPGRPRKVSLELRKADEHVKNNSLHNVNHIDVKIENESLFITDNNLPNVLSLNDTNETSVESSECLPKRRSGRSRKVSLVFFNTKDNDVSESSLQSLGSPVSTQPKVKKGRGRPKRNNLNPEVMTELESERLGTIATSTPFTNETATSLSFKSFADLELLDDCSTYDEEVPKKKRGRPKGSSYIFSKTFYRTFNDDGSSLETSSNVPIQERNPNVDSSSNVTLNSEDGLDSNRMETDVSQETESLNESALTAKQLARLEKRRLLSGRVDSSTRLKKPNDKVKCALCGEIMPVIRYQKQHLLKHNFMSWLEGEEPLPLDDMDKMDTVLIRGKTANPNHVFRCEVCHQVKKSAKGLLSHRQVCGKSDKEREGMMVSCIYCGRIMMPISLPPHMYQSHRANLSPDTTVEEVTAPAPVRKAAAKCLGKIASLIEENDLIKTGKDFHVDGDEEFDEIEEISLLYIPVRKKKTTKHLMNRWKKLAGDNKELHCILPTCTFTTFLIKDIVDHHKKCTADRSQGFSCIKCNYICKVEDEMREHVKSCNPPIMVSQSDNSEDEYHEKHVVIPYLKTAEQNLNVRYRVLFFKPALSWTKQIYEKYYSKETLYPDLHLNIDLWEEMDLQTSQFYNPEKSTSMMVSFQNSSWESLHALEGKVIEGNQGIAYTGGPVWGLEWCPGEGPQYLAVSSHLSMEFNFEAGSTFTGPGLVQLWTLEDITNARSDSLSTLQFCYGVCHNDRACWNMAWCPSGGRTDTRIGLLALATTAGSIPIYAMPNPECLQYQSTRFYKPDPVLQLELWSNERWQCSAISWSKIKPHNIIAAGFVNGVVAVWNLEAQSKLLRKNNILYPFKVFQAHHSIITGVCLSPESKNYLATASYDKSFKYWDLIDTTAPHTILKRGLFTSVNWLRHWMSAVTTYDNAYTMLQTTVSLSSVRGFVNPTTPIITGINSTAWSVSVNDWLNGGITGYDNGQVVLFLALRQATYQHLDRRKFSKVILTSTLHNIEEKDGPAEPHPKQKENETNHNNIPSNSYGDAIRKYGISIKTDPDVGKYDKFQEKGSENMNDIYPLCSINRVAWNTNRNSFLYTAMGYQSGFLVISKLSFTSKDLNAIDELSKL